MFNKAAKSTHLFTNTKPKNYFGPAQIIDEKFENGFKTAMLKNTFLNIARLYGISVPTQRGKERLRLILNRLGMLGGIYRSKTRFGAVMDLDLSQYIQTKIFLEGVYEEHMLQVMKIVSDVTRRMFFFDIGANVGQHSLYASKHLKFDRVFAFEPCQKTVASLRRNVELNRLKNIIEVNQVALSDRKGKVAVKRGSASNDGMNYVQFDYGYNENETVPTETVGYFAQRKGLNRIDIMKIDVEGAELHVLRGARELLSGKAIDFLFIEVSDVQLGRFGESQKELMQFMVDMGYAGILYDREKVEAVSHGEQWNGYKDLLYVPKDRQKEIIRLLRTRCGRR